MERYYKLVHELRDEYGLYEAIKQAEIKRTKELLDDLQAYELTTDQKIDMIIKILRLMRKDR